ncbi:MAG: GNAT family N-acetyltransferase [Thermoplasmata archaeon M9B2D]|nr:MAG: GNAT family N-acetyltransferase [Thermoplasmata archaeon M9B2D]
MAFEVRYSTKDDRDWIIELLLENWASNIIVTRGMTYEADKLPAIIAEVDGLRVGLLTYCIMNYELEIVTMNAIEKGRGVGSALLDEVQKIAKMNRCRRIWLITTNDNIDALRFYQRRDFEIVAVHRYAIEESRKLKPQLPFVGKYGIPIRDEIELEMIIAK